MRLATSSRRGFTLSEMMIASVMLVLVAVVLAKSWAAFGRSAISSVARARIAQEANLAAASLSVDLGLLARPPEKVTDSRYSGIQPNVDGTAISFTIDDGTGVLRIIQYARDQADPSKLVRTDLSAGAGTERVVATLVTGFQATALTIPNSYGENGVRIDLTLSHWTYDRDPGGNARSDHTRRFTLFVPDPQS